MDIGGNADGCPSRSLLCRGTVIAFEDTPWIRVKWDGSSYETRNRYGLFGKVPEYDLELVLNHPMHPTHELVLTDMSTRPQNICDVCKHKFTGDRLNIAYRCNPCDQDLCILCAEEFRHPSQHAVVPVEDASSAGPSASSFVPIEEDEKFNILLERSALDNNEREEIRRQYYHKNITSPQIKRDLIRQLSGKRHKTPKRKHTRKARHIHWVSKTRKGFCRKAQHT